MAQVNWVYLDDRGGRHSIGVYHGDRTGHLLIHCNRRVVQIDFSVVDTKTYSFFVEDELCEILVEKMKAGHFGYEFRVNKKIDTPRNRIRRIDNRRNNKKLALFISGIVLVIAVMFFGLKWYSKQQDAQKMSKSSIIHNLTKANLRRLAAEGRSGTSVLHIEAINAKKVGVYVFKTADSIEIRGVFPVADTGLILLQNGFPLTAGDAFGTFYLPSDPQVHRVDLFQPTHATVSQYIKTALEAEQRKNPQDSEDKCLCRVLTVAEVLNWTALADFIFQEKTPAQNPRHNHETYLRVLRSPDVAKAIEKGCWDK